MRRESCGGADRHPTRPLARTFRVVPVRAPRLPILSLAALLLLAPPWRGARAEATSWSEWSPASFERARREGRVIVLEVSASWCHWCHVMEEETWADPRVAARLRDRYLPIKVDADARPDLAERYAEYHWPATVFLTPDARTITALRGYRGPEEFLRVLDEVEAAAREGRALVDTAPPSGRVADPTGEGLLPTLRARLRAVLDSTWDEAQGGYGFGQKYPYAPAVLRDLLVARREDDEPSRRRALRTLEGFERLIDPVWGGMYQYSEGGVWTSPHFEKIASVQAGALSAFAAAYRATGDRRWLDDAFAVRRFLVGMLRAPSGAFYTSADADVVVTAAHGGVSRVRGDVYFALDDAGRRRIGLPRIDRAIYAQENGAFIEGLCDLYRASGDAAVRQDAVAAAKAILSTHRDPAGGLCHAAGDVRVLHLGDQTAFGRALLALADVTGNGEWVAEAVALAESMRRRFADPVAGRGGGFFGDTEDPAAVGVFGERLRPYEGNALAARFLLALHAASGNASYRTAARGAIAAVSDPALSARFGWRCAALCLAVDEADFAWTHATLLTREGDAAGDALWTALLRLDAPLLVRERVEPGVASTVGTTFPTAPLPAIYLCGDGRCSRPVTRAADLPAVWKAFTAR